MYLYRLLYLSRVYGNVIAILSAVDEAELAKFVIRNVFVACYSVLVGTRVDQHRLCSSCLRI